MNRSSKYFIATIILVLAASSLNYRTESSAPPMPTPLSRVPLSFAANQGQAERAVRFLARGDGYQMFLSPAGATLALHGGGPQAERAVVRLKLKRANPQAALTGLDELPGKSNYLIGNDARRWRRDVPNYARVKASAVYPGVDMVYYGQQRRLEYDFIVQPGADPRRIELTFEGVQQMRLDADGALVLQTGGGELRQHAPVIYQQTTHGQQFIAGRYQIRDQTIGFDLGAYDASLPLVIDPVLSYSTYFGGSGFDHGNAIAVDATGNIYLAGGTGSANFATVNPAQANFGGAFDCFVAKFNPSGSTLLYSTYLGGSGGDACSGLAVDAAGNVYLTGVTTSPNFPATANAAQRNYGGGPSDAFVAKLNANGAALAYATYLGGANAEQGNGLTVDADGAAYVIGQTASTDFPTRNALQPAFGGGSADAFLTKVAPDGGALVYSTYHGGGGIDQGCGLAVDADGNAYVSGWTRSTNFPTANALQPALAGGGDLFVSKLNPGGAGLLYSTYLGGSLDDAQGFPGNQLALDAAGNVYLTGITASSNFPLANAVQATNGGLSDAFVTKLNANGSALVFSTYLGGSANENFLAGEGLVVGDIAVDAAGQVYVTGTTASANFPSANAVQTAAGGGFDAFAAKLNASGAALIYATRFGGGGNDNGLCLAVDLLGNAYVSGRTLSANFQTVNPLQAAFGGGDYDAFIFRLGADAVTVSAASFSNSALVSKAIVAAFGPQLAATTAAATAVPLPTTLAGVTVRIRDSAGVERAAPLFFVSPQQINYQIPDGTAAGPAAVTVTGDAGRVASAVMQVAAAAPAIFTVNASGTGAAAALDALTFTGAPFNATQANGQPNTIAVFGTGLGADATDVSGDVKADVQAVLGGRPVTLLYAGSAPGFIGLNQFNLQLPAGLTAGTHTLVVTRQGRASNSVTLEIK